MIFYSFLNVFSTYPLFRVIIFTVLESVFVCHEKS